jgi:hypothetical protein
MRGWLACHGSPRSDQFAKQATPLLLFLTGKLQRISFQSSEFSTVGAFFPGFREIGKTRTMSKALHLGARHDPARLADGSSFFGTISL